MSPRTPVLFAMIAVATDIYKILKLLMDFSARLTLDLRIGPGLHNCHFFLKSSIDFSL